MSVDYSAEVFFGACVPKGTALGKRLCAIMERAGGTPADTDTAGVEVTEVGSFGLGKTWLIVYATGSDDGFAKGDEIEAPHILTEDARWRPALASFFDAIGVRKPPAVGWIFASTAS